jgi:hypothetical protein
MDSVSYHRPRSLSELRSFVAHYGARCNRRKARFKLASVVMDAFRMGRKDPSLARMLPVFLWRNREQVDLPDLHRKAQRTNLTNVVGYFLDVTNHVAGRRVFAVSGLPESRSDPPSPGKPEFLFPEACSTPMARAGVMANPDSLALRWNLLTRTPVDDYRSYFNRMNEL